MARLGKYHWQAAIAVTALFGLALFPGLGLAQKDQGANTPQTQEEKAKAKKAKGAGKATPAQASGRQSRTAGHAAVNGEKTNAKGRVTANTPNPPAAQARQKRQATVPTVAPRAPRAQTPRPYAVTPRAQTQQPNAVTPRAQTQRPNAVTPRAQAQQPRAVTPRRAVSAPKQGQPAIATTRTVRAPATPRGAVPTVVRPQRPSRALAGLPPAVKTAAPEPVNRQALTRQVPAASFRGPQAERTMVAVTPQVHQRGVQQFNSWVKQQNSRPTEQAGRPTHDWIGNIMPAGVRVLDRSSYSHINSNYARISIVFGEPRHEYVVMPRTTLYSGYYGQQDGFYGYQHYDHPNAVSVSMYYPYYFSQPTWYAFNYPGFYPSVYSMYGWSPGWVYPDRVYYQQNDYVYAPTPYRQGLRLDVAGQERAINDIRHAWLDDDPARFSAHLTDQTDVRVYFNDKYSYTSSTNDYYAMTADAMSMAHSASVDFNDPVWISSNEVFYTGRQVFDDPDGASRDLHISYRLRRLGSDWYIVAFGTSPDPIGRQYADFRHARG